MTKQSRTESTVREIRRKTRKKYSAEEKIRIVLECLRGEDIITTQPHISDIIIMHTAHIFCIVKQI
jgi:transposase-like protein